MAIFDPMSTMFLLPLLWGGRHRPTVQLHWRSGQKTLWVSIDTDFLPSQRVWYLINRLNDELSKKPRSFILADLSDSSSGSTPFEMIPQTTALERWLFSHTLICNETDIFNTISRMVIIMSQSTALGKVSDAESTGGSTAVVGSATQAPRI